MLRILLGNRDRIKSCLEPGGRMVATWPQYIQLITYMIQETAESCMEDFR